MKVKLILHRSYGDIELEGENFDELIDRLKEFPEWLEVIDSIISSQSTVVSEKDILSGIVQVTSEGPVLTVSRDKLTDREAVALLLYAMDPKGLRPRELSRLLSLSGFLSVGFASRLSELKREGLTYREGDVYKLTVAGKNWVEKTVKTIKYGGTPVE
ncbi:MAG: hypothetical protein QXI59_07200 [Candidatus Bathyarchaeia archaeon]|nr:hypothetical protein [Candidatus Bathyarchaeota archaeon]